MHMWMTFAIIFVAIVLFVSEWIELELVSLGVIAALLLLFQLMPCLVLMVANCSVQIFCCRAFPTLLC